MSKQYDIAIVFGRFQPLHKQHVELFEKAASVADTVLVLIGSANRPRTPKNPFTLAERSEFVMGWARDHWTDNGFGTNVIACGIDDYIYSNQTWAEEVQRTVDLIAEQDCKLGRDAKIAIVGCVKDESSFYLKMFPQWSLVEMPYAEMLDATQIRDIMFGGKSLSFLEGVLSEQMLNYVKQFAGSDTYAYLKAEHEMIAKYKKAWAAAPYAPTFVTADAVVIQSGHILLVRRKAAPGKGLLALPGGFLDQNETIEQAVIRELREETKIKVPAPVLQGSIREMKVFDAPTRSARGRTITHAGLIVLEGEKLPKVKGSDDAAHAGWYPLGSLKAEEFFEDHIDVINYFKGRV